MIPDRFIEDLKFASDVEQIIGSYVTLTRKGRNLTGLCPFHSEKTPSFTVYPETQSYFCFGCGNGGDVITFIRQMENMEYMDSLRFLADRAGMTLPESSQQQGASQLRARVLEINRESAHFFHEQLLSSGGRDARAYLLGRGLTSKTIRTFGLGYAPDSWDSLRNHLREKGFSYEDQFSASVVSQGRTGSYYDLFRHRIIFPIIDLRGSVVGFGGRLLGAQGPKYINSPDTPVFKKSRHLFSLNFAKNTNSDVLILGEGYMDVISMYQAGFENAVATLGTALTPEQSRLISQYAKKVIIAYDSDSAGQSAAKRAINLFSETNVTVQVLELGDVKDPDEYLKKYGAGRFANLLEGGKSAMDFEIDKLREGYDFAINDDKVAFLGDFCRLMSQVDNPLQRDVYIGQISVELGVSKDSVLSTVNSLRKKQFYTKQKQDARQLATSPAESAGTSPQRHKSNLQGLIAEELLLTLLLLHPDYYNEISHSISPRDFQDEGYQQIFTILQHRLEHKESLDLIHFSSSLSNPLMAKLTQLLLKGNELKFFPGQAKEYVNAIKQQQQKKNSQQLADLSPEEYQKYLDQLAADKK